MVVDTILANIKEREIDKSGFVELSMKKVVKKALAEFAFESEEQRGLVDVNLNNNFTFKGDESLMVFVLFNLLKNALYYKAKIDIWLNATAHGNYLHFQDYGVGISKDKLPSIFDSFFTANKKGGTGLGLAFCKRVMQAFGGDVICEGEYTSFALLFPKLR